MAEVKTVTVYHPDTANLHISREIPADMKARYEAAGWKTTKPKGFDRAEPAAAE
jgi:hypothetical protein